MKYLVEWKIDIWADSPEEAAQEARRIQLDPGSTALNYEVTDESKNQQTIDLWDLVGG